MRAADARRAARTTWRAPAVTAQGPRPERPAAHSKRPGVGRRRRQPGGWPRSEVPACAPRPPAGRARFACAPVACFPFFPNVGFLFFCLVSRSRWVGWFLLVLSVVLGASVRLVSAQAGEQARLAVAEKCALRARSARPAWGRLRPGVYSSLRLNLSPGSRWQRRRRAPGAGPPRSPRSSASFADNSFVRGSLHPPPPGCGHAAADSAAAGLAGAVAMGVGEHTIPEGGSLRGDYGPGLRSGGALAGVALAHGEEGRPSEAHGPSHIFASP